MMKFIVLLSITLSWTSSFAADFSTMFKSPYDTSTTQSNNAAGSSVAMLSQSCQKLRNNPLGPISEVYSPYFFPETTPVIPFVGLVYGMSQNESMLFKICDILIQMDAVGFRKSIGATGVFLNDMTGKKFDAELAMTDKINNVAESVWDFDKGTQRPGALKSVATHQNLKSLANESTKYYQRRVKGADKPTGIEEKVDRKAKLDEIARLSYERSILNDASNCPAPRGSTDYLKKYNNFVPEKETNVRNAQEEVKYYKQQLLFMGPDFISDLDEMRDYANKLNSLISNGVVYRATKTTFSEENSTFTGKMQADGKPQKKDKKVSRPVNIFDVSLAQNMFDQFSSKYVPKWEKYVKSQLLTNNGIFGIFDDKRGKIEAKYKSYAFECSEIQLSPQITPNDKSDPVYRTRLDEEREKCQKNLQFRDAKFKNLMDEYLTKLILALRFQYDNQIAIWNFEAKEMGVNRIVGDTPQDRKDKDNPAIFQHQEVSCSQTLEIAEMEQLKIKSKNNKLALKEAWLKQEVEYNIREEEALKAQKISSDMTRNQTEKDLSKANSKAKPAIMPIPPGGSNGL